MKLKKSKQSKKIKFTKMEALGNDFVVIKDLNPQFFRPETLRRLADRHLGIGCDQILFLKTENKPKVDFSYRIFNSDGGEAEQCINGAFCLATLIAERNLSSRKNIVLANKAKRMALTFLSNGQILLDLGIPNFKPHTVPLKVRHEKKEYSALFGGKKIKFGAISVGNPHAVIPVKTLEDHHLMKLAVKITTAKLFPQGTNVEFLKVLNRKHIALRIYERGTGETLACGSGAAAAFAMARLWGLVGDNVTVSMPGGDLEVYWDEKKQSVFLKGKGNLVYDGEMDTCGRRDKMNATIY
jgi:diaminopimelate epimerase